MCWAQKISKILRGIASRVMCFVLGLGWRKEAKRDAGDKKDGPGPRSHPRPRRRPRRGKKKSKQSFDREVEESAEDDSEVTIMKVTEEEDVAEREVAETDDAAVADEEEAAEREEVADEEEAAETAKKRVADEEEAAEREKVMETAKKRANEESQGGVRRRKQRRGDRPERNAMVLTPSPQPPPRLSTAYWDFTQYGKGQRNIFRLHNPPQSSAQDPNYVRGLFAEESDNRRGM